MKTTTKDFKLFKYECKIWIEYFGLKEWDICYEHKETGDSKAECHFDILNLSADLVLSIDWEASIINDLNIRQVAFHEVCELMLSKISSRMDEYFNADENSKFIHEVIRRLENSVFNF